MTTYTTSLYRFAIMSLNLLYKKEITASLKHTLNGKSFKSDNEMTNLGYCNWLSKTPV